jgi:hypothetical protein
MKLSEVATKEVHDWLYMRDLDDPVIWEVTEVIRGGDRLPDAAKALRIWFRERLTVDPGVPGPFQWLAVNLISTMLDHVSWESIVQAIRERED